MYPSGSAYGQVVKENPAYASRGIRMESLSGNQLLKLDDGDELVVLIAVKMTGVDSYDESSARILKNAPPVVRITPAHQNLRLSHVMLKDR